MPTWKGWSEQEVRGKQANADYAALGESGIIPVMAGFTAINAPVTANPPPAAVAEGARKSSRKTKSNSASIEHQESKTIASDYLGRGDPSGADAAVKQSSGPLHGPGIKKTAAKGKKRTRDESSQKNAKRRKTSDVSAGMPVTKSAPKPKKTSTTKSVNSKAPKEPKSKTSAAPNVPEQKAKTTTNEAGYISERPQSDISPSDAAPSVSVFAPTTSMNSLHSTSQQTSLDAVRSSAGQSATVYQRAKTRDNNHAGVQLAQPLLKPAAEPRAYTGSEASTRALQPRKANTAHSTPSSASDEHDGIVDAVDVPARKPSTDKKQPRTTERSTNSRVTKHSSEKPQGKSTHIAKDGEEDFIGDDEDGLIDALDKVDIIEAKSNPPSKKQPASTTSAQLPTPVNSDEPIQAPASKRTANKRKPTAILTPDEEFMQLCDEDEAEPLGLTETAEEIAAERSPTPPQRDKKLNMREVNPHEDYGGALFSDADRQLLGMLYANLGIPQSPLPLLPTSA